MKEIDLGSGFVAIVDDGDMPLLSAYTWRVFHSKSGDSVNHYASTANKNGSRLFMHRIILDAQPGQVVDHINHDTLDNRRVNLRVCSKAENQRNIRKKKKSLSGYKGVRLRAGRISKPWEASIYLNKTFHYLGSYSTPEDAARAYDAAAIRLHGEFASLNFGGNS